MLTGLQRGLVLKSKTCEEGETFYTIILGKRLLFPWLYKTATLYKDWRNDSPNLELLINKRDSRDYIKEIKKRNLEFPNEEELTILSENIENLPEDEKEYLRKSIENIPEKIKKAIYKTLDLKLFPNTESNALYGFEIQRINNLNDKKESNIGLLSKEALESTYKKALSIINFLPH